MHFCASLLRINAWLLLSFVSAVNSRKHVKLNNKKIRLVIPTLNFFVYISMLDRHFIKKEKKYLLGSFFSILVSVVIPKTEFVHVDSKND